MNELIPASTTAQSKKLIKECKDITQVIISSPAELTVANEQAAKISKSLKEFKSKHDELKKPYKEAGDKIDKWYKEISTVVQNAKKCINDAIIAYETELRRQQEEEQKRLDAIAEKKRKKAEAMAEQRRKEGRSDLADKWEDKAESVEVAHVPSKVRKVAGRAMVTRYVAEIDNMDAAKQWAIDHDLSLITIDTSAFNAKAKEIGKECAFPGWRVKKIESLQFRG